jgi:hypothetical protein
MSKKNVKAVEVVVTEITKQKGRPVNPTSNRQIRLAELEAKRKNGELKRGRPVVENSARQIRLMELEAKRQNGELKKGRPVNTNSARQKRFEELKAKAEANGGVVPKGRPKAKVETKETIAS